MSAAAKALAATFGVDVGIRLSDVGKAGPSKPVLSVHGTPLAKAPELALASPPKKATAAVFAATDLSSDEDSEEEFRRKRTPVKPLVIDPLPWPEKFRPWKLGLYEKSCSASNRSKERTLRYLRFVETCDAIAPLEKRPRKWEPFDTELCSAINSCARGPLKRELTIYQESRTNAGQATSGRALFWMLLKSFQLDLGQRLKVDIADLLGWKYKGDLGVYLDGLDQLLMGLSREPDEHLLAALVEHQLRLCKGLAPSFERFDSADEGSPERTITYLISAARKWVERKRREDAYESLQKTPKAVVNVPGRTGDNKGKGDKGNKGKKGDDKGKGKKDGKGKRSAVDKDCIAFKSGKCTFGDRCRFLHNGAHGANAGKPLPPPCPNAKLALIPVGANPDLYTQTGKLRSEIPCNNFKAGKCKLGAQCSYSHAPLTTAICALMASTKRPAR